MKKINLSPFWLGVNYWPRHQGVQMWKEWDIEAIEEEFSQIKRMGLEVVRIFLLWQDFQPEENVIDERAIAKVDQLIGLAKKFNLKLVPTFFTGHMSGENWDVPWRRERDLYTDSAMLQAQRMLLGYFGERYKNEEQILFWDLSNEPAIFSQPSSAQIGAHWSEVLFRELKGRDPFHPITLGIHFDCLAADVGFRPQDLARSNDFLSIHPYPGYTKLCPDPPDAIRSTYLASFASKLCAGLANKPALVEEFGTSSQLISSEHQRRYYESVLFSLCANQSLGGFAWCFSDFSRADRAPYNETPYEVGFGITTTQGELKPAAQVIRRLAGILKRIDFTSLKQEEPSVAIVIPERYYDNPDKEITPEINTRLLFNSFILAKQAGVDIDFIYLGDNLKDYSVLILPSVPRRGGVFLSGWEKISRYLKGGGTVFLSYNGVAFPGLEELFGLKVEFSLPEEGEVVFAPTDEMGFQEEITYQAKDGKKLLVQDKSVVLMRDQRGDPVLLRHKYGRGNAFFCTQPIELYLSYISDAHSFNRSYKIYQSVISSARFKPRFQIDNPAIELKFFSGQKEKVLFLINHQGKEQEALVRLNQGEIISLEDLADGKEGLRVQKNLIFVSFAPNQARVLRCQEKI